MLDLLAQTIVDALGFGVACINITRPDRDLEVVSVAGDPQAREMLLGTVHSGVIWDQMLDASEPWGRLRFADHRSEAADVDMLTWVPDIEPVDTDEAAWHPNDALFAPLTAEDGSRLGILSVDLPHDGRRPGPTTRRALEAFAISTALAIEHATLRSRAEASEQLFKQLATHDPLTGLGNRSMLMDRLGHAVTARQDGSMLALVFIDLDGFKGINDRHSHAAGDVVLQTVAERVRSVVRPHDTVCRWGGDEFLVLLEQLDTSQAGLEVASRVASVVAEPIRFTDHDLHVTASVGVAFRQPSDAFDLDELVRRADEAMYQVKAGGSNGYAAF